VADNRLGDLKTYDDNALSSVLESLGAEGFDLDAIGFTADEIEELIGTPDVDANGDPGSEPSEPSEPASRPTLAERFIVPPFSVLDARQGYWQERKRKWLALGIQSELGRGGGI
jgi:hypothetical protein